MQNLNMCFGYFYAVATCPKLLFRKNS